MGINALTLRRATHPPPPPTRRRPVTPPLPDTPRPPPPGRRDPKASSLSILSELSELDRVHLVIALQQTTDRSLLRRRDTQYIEELLKQDSQGASLSTVQVANAIEYQRMLHRYSSYEVSPPSAAQLAGVALASGLPFVAFGFVDNSVMITAGGEIEALVGVRWGLSTLASAGGWVGRGC